MPKLPLSGQQVRWRDPRHARVWGWIDVYGPGPFEVVRTVGKTAHGLTAGVVVRTQLGECEINEVWLALAGEPAKGIA
jgi:hypothetical protein